MLRRGADRPPLGVAINPAGTRVYVANALSNNLSVIDTSTNTVVGAPIAVGSTPYGVAFNPAGTRLYVTNLTSGTVSVIDTANDTVVGAPIPVGFEPIGVAVTPDGARVYVANAGTVSVIDAAAGAAIGSPIAVGTGAVGIAVTPDGSRVYVASQVSNTVSVIDTTTNTVVGTIGVGLSPSAFGQFIGPAAVNASASPIPSLDVYEVALLTSILGAVGMVCARRR